MLHFIQLLSAFFIRILFSEGELNYRSPKFNIVKIIVVFFLIGNLFLTPYMTTKLLKAHDIINSSDRYLRPSVDVLKEEKKS